MEARILFDDWGDVYNRYRPHSSLGYLAPAVFAAAWNSRKAGSDHIPSANAVTPGGCIVLASYSPALSAASKASRCLRSVILV